MKESCAPSHSSLLGTFKPICKESVFFNTVNESWIYISLFFEIVPLCILLIFNISDVIRKTHYGLIICLVILSACAFICLLRTWLTEPGIIPKVQATKAIVKVTPNESSIFVIILPKGQRKIASLMVSVKNDKKEYIQRTLEVFPDSINDTNIEGRTLMHVAAISDMEATTKYLLAHHPNLSITDVFGLTPIHYAACTPNSVVFPLLCQEMNWDASTWELHKQEIIQEVYQRIPQYSFEKNVYFIERNGEYFEHSDISSFFLDKPITELIQEPCDTSDSQPQRVVLSLLYFVCLCRGRIVNVMFCDSCKHFIPPRGFHCRKCDICVRHFDHHCPWVSNCVGLRNHHLFIWFMIWSVVMCLFGVVTMSVYFVTYVIQFMEEPKKWEFWIFIKDTWPCIVYMGCCVGFMAPLLNLLIYHIQISLKNETTHEELLLPPSSRMKDRVMNKEKYYPYNEGWKKNLKQALFCGVAPSLAKACSVSL